MIKIFVEFGNSTAAEKAINSLNGRFFGGRIVKAELYDQGSFDVNDLSGWRRWRRRRMKQEDEGLVNLKWNGRQLVCKELLKSLSVTINFFK